ncbi:MAG: phosphatase PAP2 family protein [Bdellovibrionota bacterium]
MINFFNKLDQNLFLWMNGFHAPFLDHVMVFLSGQLIWIPLIAFFIWKAKITLSLKQLGIFTVFLILALVLSDVTSSYILKNIVERMRPCRLDELKPLIHQFGQKCGGKYGFVSSHAANATALIFFSLSNLKLTERFRLVWILVALVCFSRIYLGVHYPGDIAGGCLVGFFWAWTLTYVYRRT